MNDNGIEGEELTLNPKEFFMPIEKVCIVCGEKFSVPPVRALTAKTCSNECAVFVRAKSRERKTTKVCKHCGKVFEVPRSHKDRYEHCSTQCKHASEKWKSGCSKRMTGELNPMWKGGETAHPDGYTYKNVHRHPFSYNNRVLKHRYNIEEWLRAEAPDSEYLIKLGDHLYLHPEAVVHHLNGNRKDNRRRNLIVCWSRVHQGIHNNQMPHPGTYWPPDAKIKLGKRNPKQAPGERKKAT